MRIPARLTAMRYFPAQRLGGPLRADGMGRCPAPKLGQQLGKKSLEGRAAFGEALRRLLPLGIVVLAILAPGTIAKGGDPQPTGSSKPTVGLFCGGLRPEALSAESYAAWELAQRWTECRLLEVGPNGGVICEEGPEGDLGQFEVLWIHQADEAVLPAAWQHPRFLRELWRAVWRGRGVFLSGAATLLLNELGWEPVKLRTLRAGRDDYQAAIIAEWATHPIFEGLEAYPNLPGAAIFLTSGGYPASADFFQTGGPRRGLLLARAHNHSENPLVEYKVGSGRAIALGWRLPHFGLRTNRFRHNLERLTANILRYLAQPERWWPVWIEAGTLPGRKFAPVSPAEWESLELAVRDLSDRFGPQYPNGGRFLAQLAALREQQQLLLSDPWREGNSLAPRESVERGLPPDATTLSLPANSDDLFGQQDLELERIRSEFESLKAEALLANPLLDFDRLLVVHRRQDRLGLMANWESNSSLPTHGYENRLAILSPINPSGELTTLFQPEDGRFVGDVELHWDGERVLFSMPGSYDRFQVFEIRTDGTRLRELPLIREPDVDNYDACYLPDGRIIFTSTATFLGVPCVYGGSHITNLYLLGREGSIRQLTVDQEHDWCPVVMNSGRVMYLRWEYTDLPHSNSRRLFSMNPDGTAQMALYGTNSYFPNSFFYARPIPGHPTKVVGIATGHHGVQRAGRLLIIDPAQGREEAMGVVQEIPGRNRAVASLIRDNLVDGVWPQFLHPYPLDEKYFLVSAQLTPDSPWGIYLVDVFDNFVLIKATPGYALLEPTPLRRIPAPPILADRVSRDRQDAIVYLTDIYQGGGLKGIPRGTVKKLRLFTYQFSYRGMGGLLGAIGMDGPWDIKRVLGTVPVQPDGSALFRVPAYTPISVQPLDADGQALQLMRSWFTAMPGEVLSCVGCHEHANTAALNRFTLAAQKPPEKIEPWYGSVRGFSFAREVQPVIDRWCLPCHDVPAGTADAGRKLPDLSGKRMIDDWSTQISGHVQVGIGGKFSAAYAELHRYVRHPGIESNIRLLTPMEFHASTTELVQMLRKGHYGVQLDAEAWDRLITWIDLNAPYHGTWGEIVGPETVVSVARRAWEMRRRYTSMTDILEDVGLDRQLTLADRIFGVRQGADDSAIVVREDDSGARSPGSSTAKIPQGLAPVSGELSRQPSEVFLASLKAADRRGDSPALDTGPESVPSSQGAVSGDANTQELQRALRESKRTIRLNESVSLELMWIPPGEVMIGDPAELEDEKPATVVKISRGFWMGRFEVTNEQFALFDPAHDSGVEPMRGYQFGIHGYPVNRPRQPVVRVSWQEAMEFCRWLSRRTGLRFSLPTEAQWEYACRAGTSSPMFYGGVEDDFSRFANLGDSRLREFALDTYIWVRVIGNPNRYDDWTPKEDRYDDGAFLSTEVGQYMPNAWGLYDMHGNVWEWTRSLYWAYPYREDDGRNDLDAVGPRVVRGGSWYDRPHRARAAFRMAYQPYQPVFNVGFRVIMEEEAD